MYLNFTILIFYISNYNDFDGIKKMKSVWNEKIKFVEITLHITIGLITRWFLQANFCTLAWNCAWKVRKNLRINTPPNIEILQAFLSLFHSFTPLVKTLSKSHFLVRFFFNFSSTDSWEKCFKKNTL